MYSGAENSMYTSVLAVNSILSSINLQRIWEVGREGRGRLISDRMSYRNYYMCSGEGT